ncbi:MAG: YihY/virulence factor BrkB family protein [Anaerolineae bacterium]|jgi:membrane protein|nr:YihY/virulence factor BrkB family protein [Anaerolineae bacterium]
MRSRIIKLLSRLREWWLRRKYSTRTLPTHLWRAFQNFNRYGTTEAASLSYYAIFSIFPLMLLLAVAVNSAVSPTVAQEQISMGLRIFLPQQSVLVLQQSLQEALQQGSQFQLIALVGLLWSALGLFSNLSRSLDLIFLVPSSRSMWRQRLLAFLMTLILIVLIISSFITSGILRLIAAFLVSGPNTWITIGTIFLPFSINLLIFVMLFRYVPSRHVLWEAIWPAAIFGAAGWEIAKAGLAWYLSSLERFVAIYGGITTAIILLLSAYVIASIFLFSAELCARLNEWLLEHQTAPQPLYVEGPQVIQLPPNQSK